MCISNRMDGHSAGRSFTPGRRSVVTEWDMRVAPVFMGKTGGAPLSEYVRVTQRQRKAKKAGTRTSNLKAPMICSTTQPTLGTLTVTLLGLRRTGQADLDVRAGLSCWWVLSD